MVDVAVRNLFNNALNQFFEPLSSGSLELSLQNGILLRNLRLRPEAINALLRAQGVDSRVEVGEVGELRLHYGGAGFLTGGRVTLELDGVRLRVQPNAASTMGKLLLHKLSQRVTPAPAEDPEEVYWRDVYSRHRGRYRPEVFYPLPPTAPCYCYSCSRLPEYQPFPPPFPPQYSHRMQHLPEQVCMHSRRKAVYDSACHCSPWQARPARGCRVAAPQPPMADVRPAPQRRRVLQPEVLQRAPGPPSGADEWGFSLCGTVDGRGSRRRRPQRTEKPL